MPKDQGAMVAYDPEQGVAKKKKPRRKKNPDGSDAAPKKKNDGSDAPPKKKKKKSRPRVEPPPEDDNLSEMSDKEEDVHDPYDEPRFKYSTAPLDDDSPRNSTCCIATAIILCIIVAIVISVVLMKVVFKKKDDENKAPAPTMAPTALSDVGSPGLRWFLESQEDVEDICDSDNADSTECEDMCANFECCDPLLAKNQSCFYYNPEGCLNYQRCHVTSSGVSVPQFNLATVCSPDRIASDPTDCQDLCDSVACCWDTDVTCYNSFYMCLDYAECQNLRPDAIVPVANANVEEFCTSASGVTQSGACEQACEPAECCWSEDPDQNCLSTDLFACMTYYVCGHLTFPGAGENVTLPESSLSSYCSAAQVNSGNTANCESACTSGSCCFDETNSCFMDDPLACLAYEPCERVS
eukprot:Nitzschia sp. Nitz4//scaffold106_size73319//15432//16661//NITZ4_005729-RA/size73319-processed-gene-0.65-mRNA-1//-1//CDS//3329532499//2912//frame0